MLTLMLMLCRYFSETKGQLMILEIAQEGARSVGSPQRDITPPRVLQALTSQGSELGVEVRYFKLQILPHVI